MDHVDWLDEKIVQELATTLRQQVLPGGIVIWRSASLSPPYAKVIADAGFNVTCISRASEGYMDRVSFGWLGLVGCLYVVLSWAAEVQAAYVRCKWEAPCIDCEVWTFGWVD